MTKIMRITREGDDGAISVAIPVPGGMEWCRLVSVSLALGASAGSENFTVTKDSGLGAAYDVTLFSQDMNGLAEHIFFGELNVFLQAKTDFNDYAGDALAIAFANSGDTSWAIECLFEGP